MFFFKSCSGLTQMMTPKPPVVCAPSPKGSKLVSSAFLERSPKRVRRWSLFPAVDAEFVAHWAGFVQRIVDAYFKR